jgi:hypothetical protein
MASEAKRIEVGFSGGQVVTVRLDEKQLTELRGAVEKKGHGWHDLRTEDGAVALDLAQVVFLRAAGAPHTIGFSGT